MGNSLSLAGKIFIYEEKSDFGMKPNKWTIRFIIIARSFAVGTAYYLVRGIPGLTSSFVAIFVALLLFDLSVAMPKFSLKFKYWIDLLEVILPRISGTIVTLSKGIIIGLVFGGLVQVGVSPFIGAVLSIGLGYHAAVQVKGNISSYVGILSALSVYEQIIKIPAFSPNLISDIGGTVLTITYATFTALFMGCICGFSLGVFTRLFLPRGYRSLTSSAYELPLYLQPFKNVLHTDDNMAVIKMLVGEKSPLAYQPLSKSGLRENFNSSVLSVIRGDKGTFVPKGDDLIYPGDTLVLIIPTVYAREVVELMKGSVVSEQ